MVSRLTSIRDRLKAIRAATGSAPEVEPLIGVDEARQYWREQGWPEVTIEVTVYAMSTFRDATESDQHVIGGAIARAEPPPPRTFADWLADASLLEAEQL